MTNKAFGLDLESEGGRKGGREGGREGGKEGGGVRVTGRRLFCSRAQDSTSGREGGREGRRGRTCDRQTLVLQQSAGFNFQALCPRGSRV